VEPNTKINVNADIDQDPEGWMKEAMLALKSKEFGFVEAAPQPLPAFNNDEYYEAFEDWSSAPIFGELYEYAKSVNKREFPTIFMSQIKKLVNRLKLTPEIWEKLVDDEFDMQLVDLETHTVFEKMHRFPFSKRIKILFTGKW